jgi:hypothetical protein
MSMRQSPPRQSPAHRSRKVVVAHANETSVGTTRGNRRKAILDPANGRDFDGGSGAAPGSIGPALADTGGTSSW